MIDKQLLYEQIMEKVSISVKLILDETFTTYPLLKIQNYFNRIQIKYNVVIEVINEEFKNSCKIPILLNKTNNFDDIQLYVWSLTENIKDNALLFKEINNAMLLVGYKYSSLVKEDELCKLIYTPNKQNELNINHDFFKNMSYIYHICPHYVTEKIKKIGFVPKSKNSIFNYDPRIHFYFGGDSMPMNIILDFAYMLNSSNKSKGNTGEYDLIKVLIPNNVKFYKDLDSQYGIYTNENISPNNIIEISAINMPTLNDVLKRSLQKYTF